MRILEIQLLANDLLQTRAFYHGVLEIPVIAENDISLSLKVGASRLTFKRSKSGNPLYHFALNIPYHQVEEAHRWIAAKKEVRLITPPGRLEDFSNWNAKAFYFFDNNGNVVEFIGRAGLGHHYAQPFGSDSLLSVSEIGLVTDQVGAQADALMARYGVPVFAHQPRLEHFAALGDDHGLFILSGNERNWYPTDVPARPFYTIVVFEEKGVQEEFVYGF